eukprot:PhM_4_TR15558/c0_g1_i1/m.82696
MSMSSPVPSGTSPSSIATPEAGSNTITMPSDMLSSATSVCSSIMGVAAAGGASASPAPCTCRPDISYPHFFMNVMGFHPGTVHGRLSMALAGLYLFRTSPTNLEKLMKRSYELFARNPMLVERLCSNDGMCMTEEAFIDHVFSVLQTCVDVYFSQNWDQMGLVFEVNAEYKSTLSAEVEYLLGTEVEVLVMDAVRVVGPTEGTIGEEEKFAGTMTDMCVPTNNSLVSDSGSTPIVRRLVVAFFWAEFCPLSLDVRSYLQKEVAGREIGGYHVELKTFNGAVDVGAVRTFLVATYPHIVLVHPETFEHSHYDFNSHSGSKSSILAWIEQEAVRSNPNSSDDNNIINKNDNNNNNNNSTVNVKEKHHHHHRGSRSHSPRNNAEKKGRWRRSTTQVRMVATKLKYAAKRQLASTALKVALMGCVDGESCSFKRRRPTPEDPLRAIFLGGGVASGKTTATVAMRNSDFWSRNGSGTIVIEADSFKMIDPLYGVADDVHQRSVDDASDLFVRSVRHGRDLAFDGTMQWLPYVEACVDVVRRYPQEMFELVPDQRLRDDDFYFRPAQQCVSPPDADSGDAKYHLELVAVTVDPAVAVQRAILRQIDTTRGVPIRSLLQSHKRFSENFPRYVEMFDSVTLYNNNVRVDLDAGEVPPVIARKEGPGRPLEVLNRDAYTTFLKYQTIDENAVRAADLFMLSPGEPGTPIYRRKDSSSASVSSTS